MTREEAVGRLSYILSTCGNKETSYARALSIAIEALKAELCEDCISRKGIIEKAYQEQEGMDEPYKDFGVMVDWLASKMPPVTPARKKGKWIPDDVEGWMIWKCHCSECNKYPNELIDGTESWWLCRYPAYCPDCGAEMEVENESNNQRTQ